MRLEQFYWFIIEGALIEGQQAHQLKERFLPLESKGPTQEYKSGRLQMEFPHVGRLKSQLWL